MITEVWIKTGHNTFIRPEQPPNPFKILSYTITMGDEIMKGQEKKESKGKAKKKKDCP